LKLIFFGRSENKERGREKWISNGANLLNFDQTIILKITSFLERQKKKKKKKEFNGQEIIWRGNIKLRTGYNQTCLARVHLQIGPFAFKPKGCYKAQ
jgi:hypothetical protein